MASLWEQFADAEAELRAAETAARAADYRPHLFADLNDSRARQGAVFGFLDRQVPVELVETDPDVIGRGAIEGGLEANYCIRLLDAADPALRDEIVARLVDDVIAGPRTDAYLEVAGLLWVLSRPQDSALRERVLAYGRGHTDPDVVELVQDPLELRPRPPVQAVPRPAPTPGVDGAEAWQRYSLAWQRYIAAFHAARLDPQVDEIAADLRRETSAAIDFMAGLAASRDLELLDRITGAAGAEPPA